MATTQYIGARYVPLFADPAEWNNTRTYEPLTIVIHEGNSYTSAQYVPKGIDISNENFWKLTGNYNAQVEQYRKDVLSFDGRITKNESSISALQTTSEKYGARITKNESSISTLQTTSEKYGARITKNESSISTLQTTSETKKTDIVVIGDSYSRYSANSDGTVVSDGTELWNNVAAKTGLNIHNFSVGGAGYLYTGYTTDTFFNQLTTAANDSSIDVNLLKCVVVYGGANDWAHQSITEMQSAVNQFLIKYAATKFANVPLIIAFNQAGVVNSYYNAIAMTILNPIRSLRANSVNVKFANTLGLLNGYDSMGSDNVHPNQNGYAALATYFSNLIMNGYAFKQHGILNTKVKADDSNYTGTLLNSFIDNEGCLNLLLQIKLDNNYVSTSNQMIIWEFTNLGSVCSVGNKAYTTPLEIYYPSSTYKEPGLNQVIAPYATNTDGKLSIGLSIKTGTFDKDVHFFVRCRMEV